MTKKANQDQWEHIIEDGVNMILQEGYRDKQIDGPWFKIGDVDGEKELTTEDRERLLINSRDRYWKTPECGSLIDSAKHYVIGKGIVYQADDENPLVQEMLDVFWNHPRNMMELRQKEIVVRAFRDGETFIRFFVDATGMSYIRFVEPEQIMKITTNKDDAEEPESYHREWVKKGEHDPSKEDIPADEMVHIKLNVDLSMARGRPYLERVIKRSIQLEQFIEGRIRKNLIASAYILEKVLKGKGGTAEQVGTVRDTMTDARKNDTDTSVASKKMPKHGSVVVHNEAIEYKWCQPHVNADDSKEDGRLIKLSMCSGVNAPEYLLSDASNANYASTMVAENPYVRSMEDYQDTFEVYFQIIFRKVIENMLKSGMIPKTSTETVVKERRVLRKLIPNAKKGFMKWLREVIVDKEVTESVPTKTLVTIEFPPMIHKELKADSEAYLIHDTMGIASKQTIAAKLGYDYAKEQEEIAKERELEKDEEAPEDQFNQKRDDEIDDEGEGKKNEEE